MPNLVINFALPEKIYSREIITFQDSARAADALFCAPFCFVGVLTLSISVFPHIGFSFVLLQNLARLVQHEPNMSVLPDFV